MADSARNVLDELLDRYETLPNDVRVALEQDARRSTKQMLWVPNPGPQQRAFECEADELFFGGQAGPGKTDLGIGLALTEHRRSLLVRRFVDDARDMALRAQEIAGTSAGYNGQNFTFRPPSAPGRYLQFGGVKEEKDKQRYKGKPHDLKFFDELPDFTESQYTFIIGWNRSAHPGQRCRIVAAGNPPTEVRGLWVIKRWAAWLDPKHPRPAKDGELRWYTTGENGEEIEVEGRGPHRIRGQLVYARSRTFIRGTLTDNPDLAKTDYDSVLAAMPLRERQAYREGRFDMSIADSPRQIIPTEWVLEAQTRWAQGRPPGVPQCAIACDPSGGGKDPMAIATRYDGWYDELKMKPASEFDISKIGRQTAAEVITHREDQSTIIIDLGGGYGLAAFEHLKTNFESNLISPVVIGFKGADATTQRSVEHQYGFNNCRSCAIWRFMEALNPGQPGGSAIALPPDQELLVDLTTVHFEIRRGIICAEPKDDVCERLGRSTNKGDAVVMCWTAGATALTDGRQWDEYRREMGGHGRRGSRPKVVSGRNNARRH